MKVFVTGANGFIGSHVVRSLLKRGHEVTALVGADLDVHNLDGVDLELRELDLLDQAGVACALQGGEALVHTAACYSFWEPDPDHIYRVNVEGTRNVLEAASRLGYQRVVYTSSTATLTPAWGNAPGTEEGVFDLRRGFQGHYKSAKVMAEMVALRTAASGLPVSLVHPTVVLGDGDRRPTPTGSMIVHFVNGHMKAYVDTLLNIVDVADVGEGHALALEHGLPGRQYILGGEDLTMREVTGILSELTGLPAPRLAVPGGLLAIAGRVNEWLSNHVTHRPPLVDVEATLHARASSTFSSARAEKELGYQPGRARVALAKAVAWFVGAGYCKPATLRHIREHGTIPGPGEPARGPSGPRSYASDSE
jgi:dihydroflavonol-4-reductase